MGGCVAVVLAAVTEIELDCVSMKAGLGSVAMAMAAVVDGGVVGRRTCWTWKAVYGTGVVASVTGVEEAAVMSLIRQPSVMRGLRGCGGELVVLTSRMSDSNRTSIEVSGNGMMGVVAVSSVRERLGDHLSRRVTLDAALRSERDGKGKTWSSTDGSGYRYECDSGALGAVGGLRSAVPGPSVSVVTRRAE